jgi:alpha-galactosidase
MKRQLIEVHENGIHIAIRVTEEGDIRLLHFSALPFQEELIESPELERYFRLVEVHVSGENPHTHHGSKHRATMPGNRLKYVEHRDIRNDCGRKLEIRSEDAKTGLEVISHYQFYDSIKVVRSWTELYNGGSEQIGLEYVSSFALTGVAKEGELPWDEKMKLHVPHNSWYGEGQWREYPLSELGLSAVNSFSVKRVSYSSNGTWSSHEFLPMGYLHNDETGSGLIWQIEHNGAWQWEISDVHNTIVNRPGQLYLQLSGPTENESHWWKLLDPGETFRSVNVAVGVTNGGFEQAIGELTQYRRMIRRPNEDNRKLPIIFNDYMNCLFGDPTTEKLLPIIDAAAIAGCEYFCIDCGWYSDGIWWDGVGEWKPSKARFPNGIEEVIRYIRAKGMIPGLWLEIEVMGIQCEKAHNVPDDWFFIRHGKRVIDHGRYQLDFRNPAVIEHANEVIDRLVTEYGVGYIKMDYNINGGIGTEREADSFGDGLLKHNRAYLAWVDSVFARYPELVIENCASGGMRMDYAMLSRYSIQSTSDQVDYRKYAVIAASAPTFLTPEQSAVWSYPLMNGDREQAAYNMVNSLLMRVHQSGHLAQISGQEYELVKEGLDFYKSIRRDIPSSLPFWPIGLPKFKDGWVSLGLKTKSRSYVAVWRLNSNDESCDLTMPHLREKAADVRVGYPTALDCSWEWQPSEGRLKVALPSQYTARIFVLDDAD